MIFIQNGHLLIDRQIIDDLWGNISHVNWVFYDNKKTLMLCSMYDDLFNQLHKTKLSMLKIKNSKGDRSISLQELIIDNDLNNSDRALDYSADEKMKILSVTIA